MQGDPRWLGTKNQIMRHDGRYAVYSRPTVHHSRFTGSFSVLAATLRMERKDIPHSAVGRSRHADSRAQLDDTAR